MKVVTIMGSPKKGGKTALALNLFEQNMQDNGHDVERINVVDAKISGCLGCYACTQSLHESGCIINDEAIDVFLKMFMADAIIYATPLYCFDVSSQLKPLIDRHFSLMNKNLIKGKYVALLITCGGQAENNADFLQGIFRRAFDGTVSSKFSTNMVGSYVIPNSGAPDYLTRAEMVAEEMSKDFIVSCQKRVLL